MILCELCKKQPSTLHLTEITGGAKKELHLCATCAHQKGVTFQSHFSLPEFLGDITAAPPPAAREKKGSPQAACPQCGITYAQFRQSGRLGCAEDYQVFQKMLLPFIERIHGGSQHAGKTPRSLVGAASGVPDPAAQLSSLRKELAKAIEDEQYERAAEIRDRIRRAEEEGRAAPE